MVIINKNKCSGEMADYMNKILNAKNLAEKVRLYKNAFTRKRRLEVKSIIKIILYGIKKPLQIVLDEFFNNEFGEEAVSSQAFSKARKNINPEFIRDMFVHSAETISSCTDLTLWNGYRLVAIDGSDLAIENSPALKKYFGGGTNKENAAGMLSMAFDPLNNYIMTASLSPYAVDERTAAGEHIKEIEKLPNPANAKYLFLADRGYPSAEFMADIDDAGHKLLFRLKKKFNTGADAIEHEGYIKLRAHDKEYVFRVIKIDLPEISDEETEMLITNLTPGELPAGIAGELYFKRWGIELKYDFLKNKLELENFSGRTVDAVQQDLWATLFISNVMTAFEFKTDAEIKERAQGKPNKNPQTTNQTRLISKFRNGFYSCILEPDAFARKNKLDKLIQDIAKRTLPKRTGRTAQRKTPRSMKFHSRRKSVV